MSAQEEDPERAQNSGWLAAGALASSALIFEAVQATGTGVMLLGAQKLSGAADVNGVVQYFVETVGQGGIQGTLQWVGCKALLDLFPLASGFLLTASAGPLFGVPLGVALVLSTSQVTACIAFFISRYAARSTFRDWANQNPEFKLIDTAIGRSDIKDSLVLMCLLRASPLLPFAFANYGLGVTSVPFEAYFWGTFLGSFPAVTVYVSEATYLSSATLEGSTNVPFVALSILATVGALSSIGNFAKKSLSELNSEAKVESDS